MTGSPRSWLGLVGGLGLTSAALSSGFIWACGAPCVADPVVWTPARRVPLTFVAALAAWWGYLLAHHRWTGEFVDASDHDADLGGATPDLPVPAVAGVAAGAGVLVCGMVVGVVYIGAGNHLLTNVGGALFLGGYVVAHYFETGEPL